MRIFIYLNTLFVKMEDSSKTTAEQTVQYIKEHPNIKSCLKKGLINYSSLARLIVKELKIEKKSSQEAVLVAARRYQDKLKKDIEYEVKIKKLISNSELEIKNKICVFITEKNINLETIDLFQKRVQKENGSFYLLEGSDNYTIITQEKYYDDIESKLKGNIKKYDKNLVQINFISPKDVENILGVISFLTSLFAENGVNIIHLMSVWTDNIFIISAKDLHHTLEFLTMN